MVPAVLSAGGSPPEMRVRCLANARRASLRLDWHNGNIRDLRAKYERACRVSPCGAHAWLAISVGDRRIRVLVHNTGNTGDCAIIYFHGGGWIVGSPATHADISEALGEYSGLPVISVDYRLAPEHKAGAAIDDGLAVLEHFLVRGAEGRGYTTAILCGDSAGGSLALAVERFAPQAIKERLLGVASFYGCFRPGAGASVRLLGRREDGLDAACIRRYWMLANASRGRGPYSVASLNRPGGSPVHLVVAGRDPLRDDSLVLARTLTARGRPVTVDIHSRENHGFLHSSRANQSRGRAFHRFSQWIEDCMTRHTTVSSEA